jgi:hypothetical protein
MLLVLVHIHVQLNTDRRLQQFVLSLCKSAGAVSDENELIKHCPRGGGLDYQRGWEYLLMSLTNPGKRVRTGIPQDDTGILLQQHACNIRHLLDLFLMNLLLLLLLLLFH